MHLSLKEMRAAILHDTRWRTQRGPDDIAGYEDDVCACREIGSAATWDQLADVAPAAWLHYVIAREI